MVACHQESSRSYLEKQWQHDLLGEEALCSVVKISSLVIMLQTSSASESRGTKNKKGFEQLGGGRREVAGGGGCNGKARNSFKYLESAIVFPPLPLPEFHFFWPRLTIPPTMLFHKGIKSIVYRIC